MPTVSVILPTFNRLHFLKLSIASVYAQTFPDWELIIADDGSTGETPAYLRSIEGQNVRVMWLAHSGNPSRVRNAAIDAARGRYLAFLDSDDVWSPAKLERQVAAMRASPQSRWSYTACDHIDADGRQVPKRNPHCIRPEGWIFDQLLTLAIGIAMPTVLAERALVDEVGRFDEQQLFGEFHDFCLRLSLKGQVLTLREQLCSVRRHNEHYSADKIADAVGWIRLYEKMAALTCNAKLRSHCFQMRAETYMRVAGVRLGRGSYREGLAALCEALVYSWKYPRFWGRLFKRICRLAIPGTIRLS